MPITAVWKRVATTLVVVPLLAWLVLDGPPWLFGALVITLSAAGMWELDRMFVREKRRTSGSFAIVAGVIVTASFVVAGGPVPALTVAVLATLAAPLASRGAPTTDPIVTTLLGLTWISWLLGHALLLRQLPEGGGLVLFLAGVTWAGESAAYGVGSMIGRRKLAPAISPNKTVEGAGAQVLASILAALALSPWLAPAFSVPWGIAAGIVLGVVGQIGDLAESVIKRSLRVKDTGGLIPGHGGVLDRLDGLLFNAPAFFYFVTLGGPGR